MSVDEAARILDLFSRLDPEARARFLEECAPDEIHALEILLPPDPEALRRARTATRDGFGWLRTIAPEIYPLEPGHHHRHLVDLLPPDGPAGRRAVVAAFRGGGKSTTASFGLPLLAAARQSHRFAVILRETLPEAVAQVDGIRKFLEERDDLLADYPWLRPLPGERGELRLAGGAIVLARSAHGAIRGLQRTVGGRTVRPDLVIGDDVYDDEAARSAMQTGRLEEWLLGTIGGLAGPAGDSDVSPLDVILIGTTIERDDLVSRMLDGRGPFASWRRSRFPVEARVARARDARDVPDTVGPDDPVAVDTEGAYVPVPPPAHAEPGDRIATWPDGAPLPYLDRLTDPTAEAFVGSRVYAREYLLRPSQPGDSLFERDRTVWVEGLAERVQAGALDVRRIGVGVDPATGEGDDWTAWATVALVRLGDVLEGLADDTKDRTAVAVLEAGRGRWTLATMLEEVEEIAGRWAPFGARVAFETAGGFVWGAQELRRRRGVAVRAVSVHRSKRTRALPLSVWHEAGRVLVDAGLRGSAWDDEVHTFTGSDADVHDDLVDATVHAATYATSAFRKV